MSAAEDAVVGQPSGAGLGRFVTVLQGIRPYDRGLLSRDLVAGVTLAALAIPEVVGTRRSREPL